MKTLTHRLSLAALLAGTATLVHAGSLGAYIGTMDTDLMGSGEIVGAVAEIDLLPFTSLQLRAGYADSFDKIDIGGIDLGGLPDGTRRITESLFRDLDDAGRFELDDFCIIPLEIGVVGRVSMFGFVGVYAGTGLGYYVVPAFDVMSAGGFSASEDIDDLTGYWGLVGIEAGLPVVSLFAEVKYTHILKDDLDIEVEYYGQKGTLTADVNLSGMMFLVGARLKW